MPNKFHDVKSSTLAGGSHDCRWPGCKIQTPLKMWGCKDHWGMIPKSLRNGLWDAYQIGQEDTGPSPDYIQAETRIQSWINSFLAAQRGEV